MPIEKMYPDYIWFSGDYGCWDRSDLRTEAEGQWVRQSEYLWKSLKYTFRGRLKRLIRKKCFGNILCSLPLKFLEIISKNTFPLNISSNLRRTFCSASTCCWRKTKRCSWNGSRFVCFKILLIPHAAVCKWRIDTRSRQILVRTKNYRGGNKKIYFFYWKL